MVPLAEELGDRAVDLTRKADRVDDEIDIEGAHVRIVGPVAGEKGGALPPTIVIASAKRFRTRTYSPRSEPRKLAVIV